MKRRSLLVLAGLFLPTAALAFPERGITLIVPFGPAGSTDIAARLLADRLSARLSARVVVENRAGAGGAVGSEAAKRAMPDGHTLLFASASSHGANPAVFQDLPYDAVRDFDAVALTGVTPLALAVAPNGPRDLAALRGALAEAPGTYGSAGAGSITHLAAELFLARTQLRAEHIPYRGGGPALEALARGEVSFVFETLASLSGIARDGRVRLLAVATPARTPTWPELPTLEEGGLAPFDVSTWNALLAPRGTPPARIATLAAAVQDCLAEPALAERLAGLGVAVPPPTGPEATSRFIAAEVAKFRGIAEGAGLRLERP
ncbi:Bug family tripartite tricarboxylate transporter substrate binding protein [Roseococcus pinisoli]|uniref:Tripartite tricarboxylate transporter substrate binding protein n=1 Tax=Roseococcus pinisoli TaxID=2835040 RepID=A0ABS5Q956_9PROT|nr:tripartite tricarboxylate transporter substrate-binding protein [Roseococcus pinisoli]MBS7809948.1 tripartite tricarboxylate transporter substrate binding protein [Roseococcus pinisoli]